MAPLFGNGAKRKSHQGAPPSILPSILPSIYRDFYFPPNGGPTERKRYCTYRSLMIVPGTHIYQSRVFIFPVSGFRDKSLGPVQLSSSLHNTCRTFAVHWVPLGIYLVYYNFFGVKWRKYSKERRKYVSHNCLKKVFFH